MLWELFYTFLRVGIVSFGGGYAVIPLIQYEAASRGWLDTAEYQEAISIAGMAPGPIATNSATLIGYKAAGLAGAVMSTLGMILPSLLAVILMAAVLYRVQGSLGYRSIFYGLRPIITGLIIYAAIHFGFRGGTVSWIACGGLAICAGSMYAMYRYKLHPLAVILASGAVGIILF